MKYQFEVDGKITCRKCPCQYNDYTDDGKDYSYCSFQDKWAEDEVNLKTCPLVEVQIN